VAVVVAEHDDDRHREPRARVHEQLGLLRLAVGREVAGDQHQVGVALERRERSRHLVAVRLADVDVAGGGHPDRDALVSHAGLVPAPAGFPNPWVARSAASRV
jgi:hypothetical protein